MTVTVGPWGSTPVRQVTGPAPGSVPDAWCGYPEASHRPRADPCPDECHPCPLLSNPDGMFDVMPGCMGGAVSNDLECCTCDPLDAVDPLRMR